VTELLAPAKLTWFLEVVGVRADGYHLLRSEMVSLDLADRLEVTSAPSTSITVRGSAYGAETLSAGRENLVWRALELCGRSAHVDIDKRIALGGGLGGGSSDAGSILRWAGFEDLEAAANIGGDVPFCIHGGRALVEGIGERISALEPVERALTLVFAPFGVNTAACYRAFDELGSTASRNHLRDAARAVEPRLAVAMDWLAAEVGAEVLLAGSGSTMFMEGRPFGDTSAVLLSPVGELRTVATTTRGPL
jgi:4-diphosphocytidyl-2-C-methyl-D-erythritol kinase